VEGYELTFLKSQLSGRWWMEVPFKPDDRHERHALLPCSYEDYELALQQEVPDRWLRALSRLNV
jgi:formiminoglutamase